MSTLGSGINFEGAVKPDAIAVDSYEGSLFAQRFTEIPSNMQMYCDYDVRTDSNPVYLGFAPRGLPQSTSGWLVYKMTYDGSNRITSRQIAYTAWSTRASATYA